MHEDKLFRTLDCNANLANADCTSWVDTFGSVENHSDEIIIPCGKCVNLDVQSGVLSLTGGLNVIGKLVVSNPIDLTTPYVIVQGELQLNSNKIWDGEQDITITLTGTASRTFLPADSNASKCKGNPCSIGKKPFVVAGGKLLVDGMPSSDYETPTWVHIHDAMTSLSGSGSLIPPVEVYPGLVDSSECSSDGKFIDENFSNPSKPTSSYDIETSLGSTFIYTENALKVSGRRDVSQGPIFDLIHVMKCVKPGVRYQVNARLKTYREDTGPDAVENSDCTTDGSGCLDIRFNWKRENGHVGTKYVYHEETSYNWQYGDEVIISETFVFDEDMLNSSNLYYAFTFYGLEPGIAIELYEFQFKLASEEAYRPPSGVCPDLALPNGDAELDPKSPFPYGSDAWYTNVYVAQDEDNLSNHFFRIIGRGRCRHCSLRWNAGLGCVTANSVYRLKLDYRLHPHEQMPNPETFGLNIRLKVKRADTKDNWYYMARCGSDDSNGLWQTCDEIYTIPEDVVKDGDLQYEIVLETETYVDYDVDNISIVKTSGPINAITVDNSVYEKWGVGAEVLITSHTNRWNDEQVRTISSIEPADESGFVKIGLNATIRAPTTMKDSSAYATEIAILSRNIKLQGAEDDPNDLHGGHLMVMHTPGDGQDIVGLEVTNMGQAGNLGRYVSFHHKLAKIDIAKLLILHSI